MSSARFGDSQLRQAGKGLLLPLLQPLHALRIFQLPVGPTPFQQLADGIGQLSLTESRKIGDDLAHQIQFAGGEHAPAERNGLFQMFRSPTAAADAATSRSEEHRPAPQPALLGSKSAMIWRTRFSSLAVSTRPQNETVPSKCSALQQRRQTPPQVDRKSTGPPPSRPSSDLSRR